MKPASPLPFLDCHSFLKKMIFIASILLILMMNMLPKKAFYRLYPANPRKFPVLWRYSACPESFQGFWNVITPLLLLTTCLCNLYRYLRRI
jgi:hypothetical protein